MLSIISAKPKIPSFFARYKRWKIAMPTGIFERVELLGKAARAFLGIPVEPAEGGRQHGDAEDV
jgi:hypothetical protein